MINTEYKKPTNMPEGCLFWNKEKCSHKGYKGDSCPQDPGCLFWEKNTIPICVACKEKIVSDFHKGIWDKDNGGPYCSKCFDSLPDELKKFTI